jgi:hypothetical protein
MTKEAVSQIVSLRLPTLSTAFMYVTHTMVSYKYGNVCCEKGYGIDLSEK